MALNPRQMLGLGNTRPSMQYQQLNQAYQSDPRRILGQTLMGQGISSAPVRTPLQGLGRLSSALVGAYLQRKAGDAQVARETEMTNQIMGMLPANATAQQRAFAAANPAAFAQIAGQAQFMPTNAAFVRPAEGGGTLYGTRSTSPFGPSSETVSGFSAAPKPIKPDVITFVNEQNNAQSLRTNDPDFNVKADRLLAAGYTERQGGGTNVSVNPEVNIANAAREAGETEFAKGMAKGQIGLLNDLTKQASLASENEDAINSILTLYNRTESEGFDINQLTGPGTEFKLELKETLATIGGLFSFDYDELGIDVDKITDQQTLRAAFNELSLEMTKKLRGAISEKELTVATRATANFGNTPEANRMILLIQKGAAAKARATENEAFRYIYGDGTEQNKGNGNLGPGTMDGKKYNSFQQYQREFVKQDDEFAIKQVVPEINSISEMKALVKISGGLNNLSDETIALMDERLAQL